MFNDIYTMWLREMKKFVRARSRIVSSLAMPVVWLFIMGFGFANSFASSNVDYTTFLAPGIIGMVILFTSIFSGVSVIYDRQFGFLKEILVAPVSRTSIVLGKTFGGATIAIINGLIMLVISAATGFIPITSSMLLSIVFMLLLAICFVSIGLILASKMKSMEGFQMMMSFLVMPIFLLSGALFPLQSAPDAMKIVSSIDPLTYGVDGLRGTLIGVSNMGILFNLGILFAFSVAFISVGTYMFRKSMQV